MRAHVRARSLTVFGRIQLILLRRQWKIVDSGRYGFQQTQILVDVDSSRRGFQQTWILVDVDYSGCGFWWILGFARQVFYRDVPAVTGPVPLQKKMHFQQDLRQEIYSQQHPKKELYFQQNSKDTYSQQHPQQLKLPFQLSPQQY